MTRAALVDVSRYQGKISGSALKNAGFCGIMVRCTIGWGYRDPWYKNSLIEAHDNDLIVAAYHVLWPSNRAPEKEAAWFAENLVPNEVESPDFIVADLELLRGETAANVAGQIERLLPAMQQEIGLKPKVYTGSWWWNGASHLGPATPIGIEQDYDLIEAEYLNVPPAQTHWDPQQAPQDPKKPGVLGRGWTEWWMWQWTSRGRPIGVESANLDYDVYNGTEAELRADLGLQKPPLTYSEKVDRLWDAHTELHHPEE